MLSQLRRSFEEKYWTHGIYFTSACMSVYQLFFKEYNITSAEYAFLLYLYGREGLRRMNCHHLYIDKSATARAIKSLEKRVMSESIRMIAIRGAIEYTLQKKQALPGKR